MFKRNSWSKSKKKNACEISGETLGEIRRGMTEWIAQNMSAEIPDTGVNRIVEKTPTLLLRDPWWIQESLEELLEQVVVEFVERILITISE